MYPPVHHNKPVAASTYPECWDKASPSNAQLRDWFDQAKWKAIDASKFLEKVEKIKEVRGKYTLKKSDKIKGFMIPQINIINGLFSKTIDIYRELDEQLKKSYEGSVSGFSIQMGAEIKKRRESLRHKILRQIITFLHVISKKKSIKYFSKVESTYHNQSVSLKGASDEIDDFEKYFENKVAVGIKSMQDAAAVSARWNQTQERVDKYIREYETDFQKMKSSHSTFLAETSLASRVSKRAVIDAVTDKDEKKMPKIPSPDIVTQTCGF